MILFDFLRCILIAVSCVSAVPWKRTFTANCSAVYPSLVVPISTSSAITPLNHTSQFTVTQDATSILRGDCLVQFSIPDGSHSCQLEVSFPIGFQTRANSNEVARVDFWTTDRVVNLEDTWTKAPGRVALFGSAFLSNGFSKVVVNSCDCKSTLSFRVCMTSSGKAGDVSFVQTLTDGLKVTHSC